MRRKSSTLNMTYVAVSAALIAFGAFIAVPSPVPFTLQTFFIFFSMFTLGGKRSLISVSVYVMLGVCGLPVFSGFLGGIGALLSQNGGFILGFIAMTALFWLLNGTLRLGAIVSASISLLSLYIIGSLWYTLYVGEGGYFAALTVTVLPFIISDVIKLALAYAISLKIRKYIEI